MDSKDFLRSPTVPAEPAPAYTPVANSDTSYHLAPLVNGRVGDIELETIDGKKFLVHKSVLEAETVFFHIYYGFVPVWRLNGSAPAPYHTSAATSSLSIPSTTAAASQQAGALSSLRKIITSTLSSSPPNATAAPPPVFSPIAPPLPPKDHSTPVTAPTPTSSPYTWQVPEPSTILTAFLSLIYPRGTFSARPTDLLANVDITGRVIRAALGYQSTKALTLARDHLSQAAWVEQYPLDVYSMACFFKFGDLARLASSHAVKRPVDEWSVHRPVMGRQGLARLQALRTARVEGMRDILSAAFGAGADEAEAEGHTAQCPAFPVLQAMWAARTRELQMELGAESDLLELLDVDLGGQQHCGHCLLSLGRTIQRCLLEARELPTTI